MAYFITQIDEEAIVLTSRASNYPKASILILFFLLVVLGSIGFWIPAKYMLAYLVFSSLIVLWWAIIFNKTKGKEFSELVFSSKKGSIVVKDARTKGEVRVDFNEIVEFDVFEFIVGRNTYGSKTRFLYRYAIRMHLEDHSYWLLAAFNTKEEAETQGKKMDVFCKKHRNEQGKSLGFVSEKINHQSVTGLEHTFQWKNRNSFEFLLFVLVSMGALTGFIKFFSYLLSTTSNHSIRTGIWAVGIISALVVTIFLIGEFMRMWKNLGVTFRLHVYKQRLQLSSKNFLGKEKIIFEQDYTPNTRFVMPHFNEIFDTPSRQKILFRSIDVEVPPQRYQQGQLNSISLYPGEKELEFQQLNVVEILAFRNYLNDIQTHQLD